VQSTIVPDLTFSNPAGAGFEESLFLDHRTIRLMKLMTSTMLSAAIKRQYGSMIVFDEICGPAMVVEFLSSE